MQKSTVRCAVTGEVNLSWEDGSIIERLREMLEEYMKKTEPEYYPPVENLLELIYEHYTETNPAAPKTTVAGRAAKEKEKEFKSYSPQSLIYPQMQ